eukprot:TRINITY_DN10565_c0_g1_i1.p1 TRINITY_DN10565_c0_g1~~TRINITY_DN10565_c0_g1_i1.p1  ORF type:complete len:473 (+),score=88.64 TRINITY_DN10565_c0_g1_i1:38-1456(+)
MYSRTHLICQKCFKSLIIHPSFASLNLEELEKPLDEISINRLLYASKESQEVIDSILEFQGSLSTPNLKKPSPESAPTTPTKTAPRMINSLQHTSSPDLTRTPNGSLRPKKSRRKFSLFTPFRRNKSKVVDEEDVQKEMSIDIPEKLIIKLIDLISDRYAIDFPLCLECAKNEIENLTEELEYIEGDIKTYESYLRNITDVDEDDLDEIERQIAEMEIEEKELLEMINEAESRKSSLDDQLGKLNESEINLNSLDQEYWELYATVKSEKDQLEEERESFASQMEWQENRLEKCRKTYFLNDAFHIWHFGHFATLNGYRLGRLSSQNVDWNEINAAWGMACLLISSIARRLDYSFKEYIVKPLGNQSKIEKKRGNTYSLYGSKNTFRLFNTSYNKGMAAFLACVNELGIHIQSLDSNFRFPYEIVKDKVNGISIKEINDQWTKAIKYMFTNIKFIISWLAGNEHKLVSPNRSL